MAKSLSGDRPWHIYCRKGGFFESEDYKTKHEAESRIKDLLA